MNRSETIGAYLLARLQAHGVNHVFGIPGDYVLSFFDLMERLPGLSVINTCDEQGAGFAADAYARIKGLGAVCITYGVGGLKIANTTAQAYAEKSPVLVISGGPGMSERDARGLLHHQISDFEAQRRIFSEFTVAHTIIDSAVTARREIDRVIDAVLTYKRPGYIELPRDLVLCECEPGPLWRNKAAHSHPAALEEAVAETVELIEQARQPVILAGVELHRFRLENVICEFAREKQIPVASTILAKSVVADTEEFYLGVFEGGVEAVTSFVEASDCLLLLGTFLTDLNLGLFTSRIDPSACVYAASDRISVRHHRYDAVLFEDYIRALAEAWVTPRLLGDIPRPAPPKPVDLSHGDRPITVAGLFRHINSFIKNDTVVIADVGDALFGASDLFVHHAAGFFSPAYYASLGFAVPAALGAQLAKPQGRPLVLVGDGAFQMTGIELSSIVRYGLNPIVIVLNNDGFGTERPMLDGSFNDVHSWNYRCMVELLGGGSGATVHTEGDMQKALLAAELNTSGFTIIDVRLDRNDRSPALVRLTEKLGKRVKHKPTPPGNGA